MGQSRSDSDGGTKLSPDAISAYLEAVDWLVTLLRRDEVATAWQEPSAIADYSVGGVAAHAVQGVVWLEQLLNDPEPIGRAALSLGEFFGPNRVDGAGHDIPLFAALRASAETFALTGAATVTAACTAARDDVSDLLHESSADRAVSVLRVPGGQVPLCDYLRTRVLEIVVHGDDVACSVPGMDVPDAADAVARCVLGRLRGAGPTPGRRSRGAQGVHAWGAGATRRTPRALIGATLPSGSHLATEVAQPEGQEDDAEGHDGGIDDVEVHVRGIGEGGAHPVVDVDERVDQHDDLQPVDGSGLHGRQPRPLVVGATQEGDRAAR